MIQRLVYRMPKAGNLKKLAISEESLADPGPGEVQVKVSVIGLNFADIFAILGLYSATPEGSFIPGLEYAGTIIKTGEGVNHVKVGDRIMGICRFGGYASHLNIEADYVVPIPEGWSDQEGASYLVQGLTAYYGLFKLGNLKEGMTVLIHSGAGGVGILANRMARSMGAFTIGSVGSEAKVPILMDEGYDRAIVRARNFKDQLNEALEGRPLNIIMECIGGRILKDGYDSLAPQGRMVVYGSARYGDKSNTPNWLRLVMIYLMRPKIDPQKMTELNRGILGFNLIWLYNKKELLREILVEMKQLELNPPKIGHTFAFEEMYDALRLFQSGKTHGKVLVNTPV